MNKIKTWIKKVICFVKTGIWKENAGSSTRMQRWIKPFRILILTVKGNGEHNLTLQSAALTIYTVMSLVPIAALIFGILKGFGFEANLTGYLYKTFSQYTNVIDTLMVFINRTLEKTSGGVIAAVGIVVLLWSVIKVFGNIEDAFNNIWNVKKPRTLARKLTDYIAVIFVAPILLVSSLSLGTYIRNLLSFLRISWLINIFLFIASLIMIWLLFAFNYWLLPNTKVKFKGAVIAGAIAGTVFFIFTVVYFYIQSRVSSYNAIYGTFAAIPLFLAWMQSSWQIVLVGGEISFAYQNSSRYEQECMVTRLDNDHKRKILLATMISVVKHYLNNEGAADSEEIATELNLPIRIVRDMLFKLESAGFVAAVENKKENKENLYIPAKDVHTIKVSDIIDAMEKSEKESDFNHTPEMKEVSKLLDKMWDKAFEDPGLNVYLPQLIK